MDGKSASGRFRNYELIGGLCFLGLFLSGALTRLLSRVVVRLFDTSYAVRTTLVLTLSFDLLCLLFLIPLLHRWLAGQFRQMKTNGVKRTAKDLLVGAGLILLALFVLSWLMRFVWVRYPEYSNGNQEALETMLDVYPLWVGLMTCVTGPIAEELMFRGLIFSSLLPHSRFFAYFLSALAFAYPHVSAYLRTVPAAVTAVNLLLYFTMGLVLARVCERGRTVIPSILLHAAYNAVMTLIAL